MYLVVEKGTEEVFLILLKDLVNNKYMQSYDNKKSSK